jgi:hypothetical protein
MLLLVATVEVRASSPYSKYDWNDTVVDPDFKVRAPDALSATLRLVDNRPHVE